MSNKNFLTISREECMIVYKVILENSNKQWKSAKYLATKGNYSSAISLSIISIEELIKSLIVLFDGKGMEFRKVKGMKAFFENHEIRFVIAYIMFVIGILREVFIRFINHAMKNPKVIEKIIAEMKGNKEGFFEKYKFFFLRKIVAFKQEMKWFSNVEVFRQEGFYCDYSDVLKNPLKVSKKEYEETIQRLDRVRKIGRSMILAVEENKQELNSQIIDLNKTSKKDNYYFLIGNAFESMHKKRQKPFQAFISQFDFD